MDSLIDSYCFNDIKLNKPTLIGYYNFNYTKLLVVIIFTNQKTL